ncbi:hypothetical protein NDU88_002986 [Pleurodeles waltl]|uniref:Uncharacterized protein n=1 Tax=Pleurodeles waltl TaxID=8319 RepID=A0AAV7MQC7_PLEWA|nr:hypothetical protein NDU88_002986 [Pleurodeles waltl]
MSRCARIWDRLSEKAPTILSPSKRHPQELQYSTHRAQRREHDRRISFLLRERKKVRRPAGSHTASTAKEAGTMGAGREIRAEQMNQLTWRICTSQTMF